MGVDAIDRDLMQCKLMRMKDRVKQRRDGSYKCGYNDACSDALQKLDECPSIDTPTVTYCRECQYATERDTTMPYCIKQNRRKDPEAYCEQGAPDY